MLDYLITGGRGFIGSNLVNRLRSLGKTYKVIDLNNLGYPNDICKDVCYSIPPIQAETLVHLASETDVRKSIKSPRETIERNCAGILNCLNLLKAGIVGRLVFTSSASSGLSMSPYLASKAACESICKAYANSYSLDVSILKLSNVYGPCSEDKSSVIAKFIKNAIKGKPLTVYGSGCQHRDFIYVSNVVDVIITGQEGYISTGELTSISRLVWFIQMLTEERLNMNIRVNYEQPILGEVQSPDIRNDIGKTVDIEDGLRKTFKWFLERRDIKWLD